MSTLETISPDDPRLTAYALGEMEPAERAEFETLLKQDAAGRALVAEINRTAHSIGVALVGEVLPVVVPHAGSPELGRAAIIPGRDRRMHDGGPLRSEEGKDLRNGWGQLLRFPSLYFTISGLAAACFAVGFIIWQAGYRPPELVQITEVDLTKFAPASAAKSTEITGADAELAGGLQPAATASEVSAASSDEGGKDNAFVAVEGAPVSTFPIKVGTAAYENVRHLIKSGLHPSREAVRIEELVNFFPYHYAPPDGVAGGPTERVGGGTQNQEGGAPLFAAHLEVASAPWAPEHRLVRIGLKGREGQKMSTESAEGNAQVIAKNVTIMVEFNPAHVQSYRLIGYENRRLSRAGSPDDKIDAGEIVAGHTVTALYEILPVSDAALVGKTGELLTLRVNCRALGSAVSSTREFPLRDAGQTFDLASADFKFAASVAAFGMILRDSPYKGEATLAQVTEWARAGQGNDAGGYRAEFVGLVGQAERLSPN